MMYYRHFGLSGAPFQLTPSAQMLFPSRSHSEGLAGLERALVHPTAGFTLLTGEPGSGKTTLAVAMLAREGRRSRVAYLANPRVGCGAMIREIMRQLGIAEHGSYQEMIEALSRYLADRKDGGGALVLVDEAHNLTDGSLKGFGSLLSSVCAGTDRLHFALIGQPELLTRLAAPTLSQVNELIRAWVALKPLPLDEAARYVDYRLGAYDGSARSVFALGALDDLLEHARGRPRRINVLCHNAMLVAHGSNQTQVTLAAAQSGGERVRESHA